MAQTMDQGEALLLRLRRLTGRAGTATAADRAQLIALIDDIETLRSALLRECARLDDELALAARREVAMSAYSRDRRPARRGH